MPMMQFVFFALCLVLSACVPRVRAQDPGCYTSGSIAGIVIATIVVTLVMAGLAAAFIWYLWKQRKVGYGDNKSLEKPIVCPPMSPDKQMIARESNDYAFDNPYFKDDETDHGNQDAAEKGESGFRKDNGDIATPVQNAKASYDKLIAKSPLKTSNGTTANNHHKKSRPFSSLPFHAVFHPSGKKQQRATMDDTYISKHLERITVPLRGHDFTGLGFNICGNMRDGIFVKDVLHRGPASESGKIKAGDRIVGVTVSFAAMVYEDALTILSYASPYDVRLEIEKAPPTSSGPHLPSSSPKRIGASTSFRNNGQRRLFHPLYRSQSIDDLTQIGKDGFGMMDSSGSQRDSSSSATPKRSQSVEASNGGMKARPPFILKPDESKSSGSSKGSRTPSTSSCESTAKATTPTDKSQPVLDEEVPCTKKEAKSARFRAEPANVTSETPLRAAPPAKPAREIPEEKNSTGKDASQKSSEAAVISPADLPVDETQKPEIASDEAPNVPEGESDSDKPTAPPRKASSTPKRKAPAPPPAIKTETSAVVHRADDLQPSELPVLATETATPEASESPPPPPTSELPPASDETSQAAENRSYTATHELHLTSSELPVFSSVEKMTSDPGLGSSDTSSLASADNSSSTKMEEQNASPGKRKASSLGDLTRLEQGAGKKTSISSAILERAVSLDLQQSIPGENLTKQKKILRAPAFEDDYLEDREDLSEMNGQGLKRWDDGLDIVFAKLPNGETNSSQDLNDEENNSTSTFEIDLKSERNPDNKPEKIEEKPVQESSTEKSITELEDDSPVSEIPPPALQASATIATSTPVKKVIAVKNLNLDDSGEDDTMDDVPYLASTADENGDESSAKYAAGSTTTHSTTLFSPVTISIPVIKPDLTHFEKLPSPPPASTHPGLESSWRMCKTPSTTEDGGKPSSLERMSVQSLYKPIFASSNKDVGSFDEPVTEKMVNGNESDTSEHYSTANETSSLETSSLSVTQVTKTAPNTIAGFAKTLIIPGPNEVEDLLSLAAEPNTPPPAPEPPAKPTEHE